MRDYLRVLAVDPGSTKLGYAVLDCDLRQPYKEKPVADIVAMDALLVEQISRLKEERFFGYSDRHLRLRSASLYVGGLCRRYEPDVFVLEDAYLNRRQPWSYRSLSEGIIYIHDEVLDYDEGLTFILTEATRAKAAVGAKAQRGGDQKEIVNIAIRNNPNITKPKDYGTKPVDSRDAVALAYFGVLEWWKENGLFYRDDY